MRKIWKIKEKAPSGFFDAMPEYPRIVLQLLFNRNISSEKEIENFLNADYESETKDPFLVKDMKKAVLRIFEAVKKKEKIIIYGDYDVDGVCGSAILHILLSELKADFSVFIPDRFKDGYGLNTKALEEIIALGAGLVITVDCGITDFFEVEFLNKKGIDVIITDHHLVLDKIPKARAVINLKQKNDKYPFKFLCGSGVVLKLAQASAKMAEASGFYGFSDGWEKWLLDLAAIATVADMVPLVGENRVIVKYGLIVLAQTKRVGLKRMLRCAGIDNCRLNIRNDRVLGVLGIDAETLGFIIGPRLNAASRMDHAVTSFNLLVTNNKEEAETLAKMLESHNRNRQKLILKIMQEAEKMIDLSQKIIFVGSQDWSRGVIGLVAGRLCEKYNRPVFVYQSENGLANGSVRGIEEFNVVEAMERCADILIEFGGHAAAGGFSVKSECLEEFKKRILEIGAEKIADEALVPKINIDCVIKEWEFGWETYDLISRLEPFGKGNEPPVFMLKNLQVVKSSLVGNGNNHLKMEFYASEAKKIIKGIGFGLGGYFSEFEPGGAADVVFSFQVNEWNGSRNLEMKIIDIAKSQKALIRKDTGHMSIDVKNK